MKTDLITYYRDRAQEYEKIYEKPERKEDLEKVTQILKDVFSGKEVFEIACGTGYWTERIAQTARSIKATDINEAVLKIARSKSYSPTRVSFSMEDINHMKSGRLYECLFGGFIWSHIKKQELAEFIEIVKKQVTPGGTLAFIDNNFVKGSSTLISRTDEFGNTFQRRMVENGTVFEVLKNFPNRRFIRKLLKQKAGDIQFIHLKFFWVLIFNNL